ncbi:uncharacterized protein LOC129376307 [Poeciliopsis prolifica]|uniref:uncharacterized protein LOC129376307 n=1 Tax=Poeciliopsis prolifica TaxID=188132 RepID=UPI0024142184|nr:uncharacterized protein LOC129376307 [Poeciliopsis prolifica]
MAAEQTQNRVEYKDNSNLFQTNAFRLIYKMLEMASRTQEDTSELVDEILHSIFFLGEITQPEFSPRELFLDNDIMFDYLREAYPEPFRLYSSRLPRRSPFSCVLDMVVHLKGQEHEDDIRETLKELITELKRGNNQNMLISTTICISAGNSRDSVKHYGVSMSTTGRPAGRILVAASCLNFWEKHVADAVMSYYPIKSRKAYFDVTIKLPADVRCEAFNLGSRKAINPCLSCKNMFGLDTTDEQEWPYGNCAEVESLSNLLREEEVRERVQRFGNWTVENKEKVKRAVINHLRNELKKLSFAWDNQFYTAQKALADNDGEEDLVE